MASPTVPTVKRLFALSGNTCAFPNCTTQLVNPESGVVIGEISHIAGNRPGAPRYAPAQTDQERQSFDNLMLLCPTHHRVVDERPEDYTSQALQTMKAHHEAAAHAQPEPSDELVDDIFRASASQARTLDGFVRVLGWSTTKEERNKALLEVNALLPVLAALPRRSREFFAAILRRAEARFLSMRVLWPEVQRALRLDDRTMSAEVGILEDHRLVTIELDDRDLPYIVVRAGHEDWIMWDNIRDYCAASGLSLLDIIVNLSFDNLD